MSPGPELNVLPEGKEKTLKGVTLEKPMQL